MESSEMQKKAISLGDQLVEQLSTSERADTFSRWVAHYVAEQMVMAESATGPEKAAAEERSFNAILVLWSHRSLLPNGLRPFEDFEPILRALARLDPEQPRSMYSAFQQRPEMNGEPSEVCQLVDFVLSLDRVARVLINFALLEATAKAVRPKTKLLLENAIPSSMTSDLDAIRELVRRNEVLENDAHANGLQRTRAYLEELERFCSLCDSVKKDLKIQLKVSTSTKGHASAG
jgi:hypothetical protein